ALPHTLAEARVRVHGDPRGPRVAPEPAAPDGRARDPPSGPLSGGAMASSDEAFDEIDETRSVSRSASQKLLRLRDEWQAAGGQGGGETWERFKNASVAFSEAWLIVDPRIDALGRGLSDEDRE